MRLKCAHCRIALVGVAVTLLTIVYATAALPASAATRSPIDPPKPGAAYNEAQRPGSVPDTTSAASRVVLTGAIEWPPTYVNVVSDEGKQQVITENHCDNPVSVKILVAFGRDSDCRTVPPNRSDFFFYNPAGRFDGVVLCA